MKSKREHFQERSSSFALLGSRSTKVLILLGLILLRGGISISHVAKGAGKEEIVVKSTLWSLNQDRQQSLTIFITEVNNQWEQTYGGPDHDEAYAVIQTTDGGFALAGFTTDDQGPGYEEARLVKTDPRGEVEWTRTYGGVGRARAYSVIETTDRGFVLAGYTKSTQMAEADGWLAKTDVYGMLQWNQTYGGIGWDEARAVIETIDGGFAFAGHTCSYEAAGVWNFWLVKTDVYGVLEWHQNYGGEGQDRAYSVIQSTDGGFVIAGHRRPYEDNIWDTWLVKTDDIGSIEWNKTYGDAKYSVAYSIIETTDGGFAFSGSKLGDAWLVKINATGEVEWIQTYGDEYNEEAYSVIQATDGGFVLACYTWSYMANSGDAWLVKTNTSGELEWSQTRGDIGYDIAYSVIQTVDGNFVFAGATTTYGTGDADFWLVKTIPMDSTSPSLSADTTPPSISKPADLAYEEGTMNYFITWTVGDRHPGTYAIYIDSILVDSGSWTNKTITCSPVGLPPGTYNVTLVVWDAPENRASDTVWVDVIAPSVKVIPTTPTTPPKSSTKPPSFFVPGLTGIPILVTLVVLGLWRKRK